MRRYLYLAAVVGSTLCATLVASTAAYADAGAVLTVGAVGGPNAAVGDAVVASLASGTSATFYSTVTGSTGVSCASSTFSTAVTVNPSAPGLATETLDDQTFATCTTNVVGTTGVRSVVLNNLHYTVSVDGNTKAVTVSPGSAGAIPNSLLSRYGSEAASLTTRPTPSLSPTSSSTRCPVRSCASRPPTSPRRIRP